MYGIRKMTSRGYSGIMVKDEVAEKVRAMAKAEGKTISAFIGGVLDVYNTKGRVCDISNTSMMKLEGDIEAIMRDVVGELRR